MSPAITGRLISSRYALTHADRLVREVMWWRAAGAGVAMAFAIGAAAHLLAPIEPRHRLRFQLTWEAMAAKTTAEPTAESGAESGTATQGAHAR